MSSFLNQISLDDELWDEYKYKIGDIVKTYSGEVEIIDRHSFDGMLVYRVKCLECEKESFLNEEQLNKKLGCPNCDFDNLYYGKNTLSIYPELVELLVDKEQAYNLNATFDDEIEWVCPQCGKVVKRKVNNVTTFGFKCDLCSVKNSYPERFLLGILIQFDTDIKHDRCTEWSQNRRYDFISKKYNMIVETHGIQHYLEENFNFSLIGGRNTYEEVANDKFKKELALENGIKHYIEIDCREIDFEYIKDSVMQSELRNIIDLNKIDWKIVDIFINKSFYHDIIQDFNDKVDIDLISYKYKINRPTIVKMLRQGTLQGLCHYKRTRRWNTNVLIDEKYIRKFY